ncbi:hypothetical protein RR42_s2700 [Cupriavidus basilensis]|uniref:Uncharacterized protein n=1 Tax=Cupriavidus basilensis TaxID=68895 RepID=A0A0C4YEW4_9BURK|nr:hypothetical protein RR42_s2700 [Cupriavidus basilensis]
MGACGEGFGKMFAHGVVSPVFDQNGTKCSEKCSWIEM